MLPLLYTSLAFGQATLIAVGDAPAGAQGAQVEAPAAEAGASRSETPEAPKRGAAAGGWVAVLADCLEERAPRRWSVVDRASLGDSPGALGDRVGSLADLKPRVVVLGFGAREVAQARSELAVFREEVQRTVASLRALQPPPGILLLGLVPPTADQLPEAAEQAALDERTRGFNGVLSALAESEGVVHLDLQGDWPGEPASRRVLTLDGWRLSDQGHARVAATVCDAVLTRYSAP